MYLWRSLCTSFLLSCLTVADGSSALCCCVPCCPCDVCRSLLLPFVCQLCKEVFFLCLFFIGDFFNSTPTYTHSSSPEKLRCEAALICPIHRRLSVSISQAGNMCNEPHVSYYWTIKDTRKVKRNAVLIRQNKTERKFSKKASSSSHEQYKNFKIFMINLVCFWPFIRTPAVNSVSFFFSFCYWTAKLQITTRENVSL